MKQIEDKFQPIAAVLVGGALTLAADQHQVASEFYALWSARSRAQPEPDAPLFGILPDDQTKDQQEILESKRYITSYGRSQRPSAHAITPGRHISGLRLRSRVDAILHNMRECKWGVVKSTIGEFLVPDANQIVSIPVSPTICLVAGYPDGGLPREEIAALNRWMYQGAADYVLARDFAACPL